jgi:RimJ/RimL family protein N-acetyltransferase
MFQPLFRGKLMRLAAPLPEDKDTFARWTLDDDYLRLLDDDPIQPESAFHFSSFDSARSSNNSYYFHLRTLSDDRLIGFVVLFNIKWASQTSELAIGIGEADYRGKGYGSDTLSLILNYAFNELNLFRVGLNVMDYNTKAIAAYERAGFVREGLRRKAVLREGMRYDLVQFGILRDEWQSKNC